MNLFSIAQRRLRVVVMSAVAVMALAALAAAMPGFPGEDNGNGNAYGKNKEYPYGVNQQSSRPYAMGYGVICRTLRSRRP